MRLLNRLRKLEIGTQTATVPPFPVDDAAGGRIMAKLNTLAERRMIATDAIPADLADQLAAMRVHLQVEVARAEKEWADSFTSEAGRRYWKINAKN